MSICSPCPVHLICSGRKWAPSPALPHALCRALSRVCATSPSGFLSPRAPLLQPRHKPKLRVPAFRSLLLRVRHLRRTCRGCVLGACRVLACPAPPLTLASPQTLPPHASDLLPPSLHGAKPEATSWPWCTWPLSPLVLEPLLRMLPRLGPWAPPCPAVLAACGMPEPPTHSLPGVLSWSWYLAPDRMPSLLLPQPPFSSSSDTARTPAHAGCDISRSTGWRGVAAGSCDSTGRRPCSAAALSLP